MKKIANFVVAWLVINTPIIGSAMTLNFDWRGRWYNTNGIYKFKVGDSIELKSYCSFGYGLRPQGTVKGFIVDLETSNGYYLIDMTQDDQGDFFRLMNEGWIPDGVTRSTHLEKQFKWNIEFHFKKCTTRIESSSPLALA